MLAQQRNSILPATSRDLIINETRALLLVQDHAGRRLIDVAGNGRFVRNVLESAEEYRSGLVYGTEKPEEAPLVYALVTKDGVERY